MISTNPEVMNLVIFFRDFVLGLIGLSFVLVFHGFCVMRVVAWFELKEVGLLNKRKFKSLIISVYNALSLLAITHIIGVMIWAAILYISHLVSTPIGALLFAGSCYLTLGFIGDVLPNGWKSLALFISFSGLFSTAWTTSAMVGLTNSYKSAWVKLKHLESEEVKIHRTPPIA